MTFECVQGLAADTQWRRTQGVGFARHLQTVPLVAVELFNVVLSLPVAIVPEGIPGWRVVALMGTAPGSNACVGPQGQWLSRHVPAALRGHPFVWQTDGDTHEAGELALLSEARVLGPSSAPGLEPVWAEDGRLSAQVLRVQSFLQQVEQGVQALSVAAAQLHSAGLLELWVPDGAVVPPVAPWHRVKESALNALPNAEFAALRASGALALAYAQMLSTGQWPMLQRLGKLSAPVAPVAPTQVRTFIDPSAHSFLQSLAESQD